MASTKWLKDILCDPYGQPWNARPHIASGQYELIPPAYFSAASAYSQTWVLPGPDIQAEEWRYKTIDPRYPRGKSYIRVIDLPDCKGALFTAREPISIRGHQGSGWSSSLDYSDSHAIKGIIAIEPYLPVDSVEDLSDSSSMSGNHEKDTQTEPSTAPAPASHPMERDEHPREDPGDGLVQQANSPTMKAKTPEEQSDSEFDSSSGVSFEPSSLPDPFSTMHASLLVMFGEDNAYLASRVSRRLQQLPPAIRSMVYGFKEYANSSSGTSSGVNDKASSDQSTARSSAKRNSATTDETQGSSSGQGDDEEKSPKRTRKTSKSGKEKEKFACLFNIKDHKRYCVANNARYSACMGPGYPRIRDLKQHLWRSHMVYQCTRCWAIFENRGELVSHRDRDPRCEPQDGEKLKEGILHEEWPDIEASFSRKVDQITQTDYEIWFNAWRKLFPGLMPPRQPYYLSTEYPLTHEASESMFAIGEVLWDSSTFLQSHDTQSSPARVPVTVTREQFQHVVSFIRQARDLDMEYRSNQNHEFAQLTMDHDAAEMPQEVHEYVRRADLPHNATDTRFQHLSWGTGAAQIAMVDPDGGGEAIHNTNQSFEVGAFLFEDVEVPTMDRE